MSNNMKVVQFMSITGMGGGERVMDAISRHFKTPTYAIVKLGRKGKRFKRIKEIEDNPHIRDLVMRFSLELG